MSDYNKEAIKQLKELASILQNIAYMMSIQYKALSLFAYSAVLYILLIFSFLMLFNKILRETGSVCVVVLIFFILEASFIVNSVMLHKHGRIFWKRYNEGHKILQMMSDKSEWTRFKKRLIYRGDDEKISNAVDVFFIVSEKTWSPCRSERKYYSFLVLITPTCVLFTFLSFVFKLFF